MSYPMNILILGETGVGKSTWINSFINYLTYDSLEEAENGELLSLIPSEFKVCDENYDEIAVTTGVDHNEVLQAGQSATQGPKVYCFAKGNNTIRLIDTPGIGDTRGVEQDQKNFQNILSTLCHLEEIHGICILLKPNNARLTVMFRFCIQELLTHLHRDASKNVLFCFTNSRGTFYRPGETMPALKKLLAENEEVQVSVGASNVFCFDSEAYRFLAAVKNETPVNFPENERINVEISWDKSIEEMKRMLTYIRSLPTHNIKDTLRLSYSRELLSKLGKPLAEISRTIQISKAVMEDQKQEIEQAEGSMEELKDKLLVPRHDVEVRPLDYPRTVCVNSTCVKTWEISGVKKTEYSTVCEERCDVPGISADTVGDPQLLGSPVMTNGMCNHCGHSYREHLNICYETVVVTEMVPDPAVENLLNENLSDVEIKEKIVEGKNEEIQECEEELKKIEQVSFRFAYFLKKNAITPYNDAMEQYLNHLIQEEEEKVGMGESRAALDTLMERRDTYVRQREILEQQMDAEEGDSWMEPPEPQEVDRMMKELQGLKHSGKALEQALVRMNVTPHTLYTETVVRPPKWSSVMGEAILRGLEWCYATGGDVPKDAISAGIDSGNKVYIARANMEGGTVPGKLHTTHNFVYVPYDGKEVPVFEYEVLCGPPKSVLWVKNSGSQIPPDAVEGGRDPSGETMYIGRVFHKSTLTTGKVHPSHGCCYVPYDGKEIAHTSYEILVRNKL